MIQWHREARAEVRAARRHYHEANPVAARAFVEELNRAIASVESGPERWPLRPDGTRRRLFRRFPFAVIYVVGDGRVVVIAIAHHRRRPGYWMTRVEQTRGRRSTPKSRLA